MSTLERVHIRLTRQQRDFISCHFGNISMWVRTKIDREIGAMEARLLEGGPRTESKQKDQLKPLVWKL